jgi:hypothetical protein
MKPKNATTAAVIAADLESAIASKANADAAIEQIDAGRAGAEVAGGETLVEFDRKHAGAINAQRSADARVKMMTRDLREAEEREAETKRAVGYDTAFADHEKLVAEVPALAKEVRGKIGDLLKRAARVTAAVQAANASLPAGRAPLPLIERDPRLAAGDLFESSGLATIKRAVTVFDPVFWIPAVQPPAPRAKATKNAVVQLLKKPTDQEPAREPGAFRPSTFATLPRETEPASRDETGAWREKTFLKTRG